MGNSNGLCYDHQQFIGAIGTSGILQEFYGVSGKSTVCARHLAICFDNVFTFYFADGGLE